MNKKGEGTASSMFMALFMVTMVLVLFSTLVVDLVGNYDDFNPNLGDVTSFSQYQAIYDEMNQSASDFVKSQDANESDQTLYERFEDNVLVSGFKAVLQFPKMLSSSTKVLSVSLSEIGFSLPQPVKVFLFLLLGFGTTLLVVIAYWRWNRV